MAVPAGSNEGSTDRALQIMDVSEPLVLMGSCNDWGKDLEAARKSFTFGCSDSCDAERQEKCLELSIHSKKHLSFQIVSAKSLWDWRIHPADDCRDSKELKRDRMAPAQLTVGKDDKAAHGRNFRIRETPPAVIQVKVLLSRKEGISVWYGALGLPSTGYLPRLEDVAPWQSPEEVGSLRLTGGFCRCRTDVEGLNFRLQETAEGFGAGWRHHQLCFRMQHREVKFQIISDRLGYEWRLCPKRSGKSSVIPKGSGNGMEVVLGRKKDGHGRRYFRVTENYLTVLTLNVWMEVTDDRTVGRVTVAYAVEDTGLQVAIGLREFQYPPKALSQLDVMIQKICQNPRLLEVVEDRLRAVVTVVRRELNTRVLRLAPASPGRPPAACRVAAMLMLLPSALGGWPGVFRCYLRYHLLSPGGPRLAHLFVFLDEPPQGAEAEDAPEAEELRPLVTLLDGSGPASLGAAPGRRKPELDAKLRAAAVGGELVARQMLNMERCLELAETHECDWLLCNLDADEALMCMQSIGELFAAVPTDVWQLQIVNHEAVLETSEPTVNFFHECTLFKRNPLLLMESKGRSDEQKRCMDFWGKKVAAAAAEVNSAWGEPAGVSLRPSDGYFSAYFIGKSAVRVSEALAAGALPAGPHDWTLPERCTARVDPEEACILHYSNCQGAAGLVRKYSARTAERWNKIEFHNLCQSLYSAGHAALEDLIRRALVLREEDNDEVAAQLAAGVCMRIAKVRDACFEHGS